MFRSGAHTHTSVHRLCCCGAPCWCLLLLMLGAHPWHLTHPFLFTCTTLHAMMASCACCADVNDPSYRPQDSLC